MIDIDHVSFQYSGAEQENLQDFNLQIKKGECVVLTGESGCGKTCVTRLINTLIPHFYEGEMSGAVLPGMGGSACASCAACCPGVLLRAASRARLLIRFFVPFVSLISIAPFRLIFCVILSRGFNGSFKCYHLQSAPLQGRNTRRSVQCQYSGGQGFSLQARWCRFQKTGQGQRRLPDSPPVCTFPRASGDRRQNARPYTVRY